MLNSDHTRNLAWFTDGLRPGLRSANTVPVIPGTAEPTITQELTAPSQELLLPQVAVTSSRGRHRRPSPSLLTRIRRAAGAPPKY